MKKILALFGAIGLASTSIATSVSFTKNPVTNQKEVVVKEADLNLVDNRIDLAQGIRNKNLGDFWDAPTPWEVIDRINERNRELRMGIWDATVTLKPIVSQDGIIPEDWIATVKARPTSQRFKGQADLYFTRIILRPSLNK